jgi:competence ComEA-like helix-hairpin-helix protein
MDQTRQNSIQSFVFVLSVSVALGLCLEVVRRHSAVVSSSNSQGIELESRINPNKACIESLARLPGLGPKRAGAIVAYRDNCNRTPAFEQGRDLQNVKGIGPKTVQNIEQWMEFD